VESAAHLIDPVTAQEFENFEELQRNAGEMAQVNDEYVFPADRPSGLPGVTSFNAGKADGIERSFVDPISMLSNLALGRAAISIASVTLKLMGRSVTITKIRVTDPRDDFNRKDREFNTREQIAIDRSEHRQRVPGKKVMDA
jgi:hypothetical protein